MSQLTFQIRLGAQGEEVSKLHKTLQYLITNQYLQPDIASIDRFSDEIEKNFFGEQTNLYAQQAYRFLGLEEYNNFVDENFYERFQERKYELIASLDFKLSGVIYNQYSKPIPKANLKLFKIALKERREIATILTDENGAYNVIISRHELFSNERFVDFQFDVEIEGNKEIYRTDTFYNINESMELDITVSVDIAPEIKSEFELINNNINNTFGSDREKIDEDEANYIAAKIGETEINVLNCLLARKYAIKTKLDADLFYAILNRSKPQRLESIINMSLGEITEHINFGIATNVISHKFIGTAEKFYNQLAHEAAKIIIGDNETPEETKSKAILSHAFSESELPEFLNYYFKNNTDYDVLTFDRMNQELSFVDESKYKKIEETFKYSSIAGNNPAILSKLLHEDNINLVAKPISEWVEEVSRTYDNQPNQFIFPDYITADSKEEKIAQYAEILKNNVDSSFPGLTIQKKIVSSEEEFPLNTLRNSLPIFAENNPEFDILKTSILDLEDETKFNFEGVLQNTDKTTFINEISSFQKVNMITRDYDLSKILLTSNYKSATDIALADRAALKVEFQELGLSEVQLRGIQANADLAYMSSVVTATEVYGSLVNPESIYKATPNANAEWRTLFPNTLDMCCCDHCSSVFSPAAYMVDCLELLRRQNPKVNDWLKLKRPDIWQVELSCKNTNTSLPYIDLVNEILEEMILASKSGTTSFPAIKAYNTTWDEKTLDAIPENINNKGVNNPYGTLKNALYPWTGPYNYFEQQINEHLKIIDLKPFSISSALNSQEKPYLIKNIGDACIYLGINNEFKNILLDDTTTNLAAYYGLRKAPAYAINPYYIIDPQDKSKQIIISGSNFLPTSTYLLNRVDIFLQQSGECYKCLLEILDCYYINPVLSGTFGNYVRKLKIDSIAGKPLDTCNLNELFINGLQIIDLRRIHTFFKLQKKLGWTKYQLDKVFTLLGKSSGDPILENDLIKIAQLKYISELLGKTIEEILIFWRPINDVLYSDYRGNKPNLIPSEYETYFRNNQVIQDFSALTNYPFTARMSDMNTNLFFDNSNLQNTNYFLGATSISQANFEILFNGFKSSLDKIPTMGAPGSAPNMGPVYFHIQNLTRLISEERLAASLGCSMTDWVFYRTNFLAIVGSPFTLDATGGFSNLIDFVFLFRQLKSIRIEPADIKSIFFDEYESDIEKDTRKEELTFQVNGLKILLSKSAEKIEKNGKIDEDIFKKKLGLVFRDDTVDLLLNKIGKKSSASDILPDDKAAFIAILPSRLTVSEKNSLQDKLVNASSFITDEKLRLIEIDKLYSTEILNAVIIKYFEKLFKLPSNIVESFLNFQISGIGKTGLELYNSPTFIEAQNYTSATLISGNDLNQRFLYQRIDSLSKLAQLIHKFNLSYSELTRLRESRSELGFSSVDLYQLPTGKAFHQDEFGMISGSQWIVLLQWLFVRSKFIEAKKSIFEIIYSTNQKPNAVEKSDLWTSEMAQSLGINPTDLTKLTTLFAFNFASSTIGNSQNRPETYLRLIDVLDLMSDMEINAANLESIVSAIKNPTDQNTANKVIQVVKAKFSNDEWLSQVKPVNDRLRIARRDAMVDYLLLAPPVKYETWTTANDIYESLYIDTQMMPIVKTSRIKQYISSIQVFYDRCILQLEKENGVIKSLQVEDIRQWNLWRKYYRVWEANRKVFIYPENWIEPELRDDKSPFFKELEKYLKQNDITEDNMRDAYETYLEKLEEVSNLEIVAIYNEFPDATDPFFDIVHVWGRTYSHPHIFYYRKRVQNEWTAWEKMNVEIEGDHFVAAKHQGRLKFFWLTFEESSKEKPSKIKVDEETAVEKFWKIGIRWTEYKNGKWVPIQVGKENLFTNANSTDKMIDLKWNIANRSSNHNSWMIWSPQTQNLGLNEVKGSIIPYAFIEDGNINIVLTTRSKYTTYADVQLEVDKRGYNDTIRQKKSPISFKFANVNFLGYSIQNLSDDTYYDIIRYCYEYNYKTKITKIGYFSIAGKKVTTISEHNYNTVFEQIIAGAKHYQTEYSSENSEIKVIGNQYWHLSTKSWNSGVASSRTLDNAYGIHIISNKLIQNPDSDRLYQAYSFPNYNYIFKDGIKSYLGSVTSPIQFYSFFYTKINRIISTLNSKGIDGILKKEFIQEITTETDELNFNYNYSPSNSVIADLPTSNLKFNFDDPNAIYTWELFFHIPMLIANKLMKDQKFFEAMKWYHYVFNPYTSSNPSVSNSQVERFWQFYPFYQQSLKGVPTIQSIMDDKSKKGKDELEDAVKKWAANPFKPHLVARMRMGAYMKNVVMKYIDNLVAWGDMLFRRDTMESINEAILLYVLAAQLLGRKPNNCIPQRASTGNKKYQDFVDNPNNINAFSNALQRIESVLASTGVNQIINNPLYIRLSSSSGSGIGNTTISSSTTTASTGGNKNLAMAAPPQNGSKNSIIYDQRIQVLPVSEALPKDISNFYPFGFVLNPNVVMMQYFCIPQNEKLLSYWDLVADRLFKIRNSQNIEGVERQLALFEPPIDPAILVKAVASGMSLADAISDLYAPMPTYRFQIMVQKASELAQEVKSLGQSLLSALEKKDAESIALLRSTKEIELLEMVKDLRAIQIKEAQHQLASLQQQEKMITLRRDFYNGLISGGLNEGESTQLDNMKLTIPFKIGGQAMHMLGGFLNLVPDIKAGGPFTLGAMFGGRNLGHSAQAAGDVLNMVATILDIEASMAGIKGGYARREAEWKNQLKTANIELKQMEKQLLASQIRVEMANFEYNNHLKQIDNAKSIDEAMHNKYTNEDLYDWMIGEISSTYFQSYKLAFDVARKAERCYHFELATEAATSPSFIQFGYWDSLKKGLLAGESLLFDIKRMDVAYLDNNKRLQEMTKHISLAQLFPQAIMDLKKKGLQKCTITLPEWLFDMDHPGQYLRRIKSVSISIPCVAGPYTTVAAKLTLNTNKIRKTASLTGGYADSSTPTNQDPRFSTYFIGGQSITTSSAQNDSGMFELNFKDERYLPFEGAGVISEWTLEIPSEFAQFDINSISDVIMHINYTAKYDGGLKSIANTAVGNELAANNSPMPRVFNLKQEFANEWNAYVSDIANNVPNPKLKINLDHDHFPQFCKDKELTLTYALVGYKMKDGADILTNNKLSILETNLFISTADVSVTGENVLSSLPSTTTFTTSQGKDKLTLGSTKEFQLSLKKGTSNDPLSVVDLNAIRDLYFVLIYKK